MAIFRSRRTYIMGCIGPSVYILRFPITFELWSPSTSFGLLHVYFYGFVCCTSTDGCFVAGSGHQYRTTHWDPCMAYGMCNVYRRIVCLQF